MRTDLHSGTLTIISLLAIFSALNSGCGGGGVASNAPVVEGAQASNKTSRGMQVPMMGYAYAAGTTEIRGISGISGASTQGSPLNLPANVAGINFSPGQKSAIVQVSSGGPIGAISFQAEQPGPLETISGAVSQPAIIAFSPTGVAAAIYSSSEGRLQVVTGLPNIPQLTRDLTSAQFAGSPQFLAIADDGLTLLEGTSDNALYLISANGPQLLANASALGGMTFNPKSTDALIYDRGAGTLTLIQSVGVLHSTQSIANGLTGLDGTVFIASDGRTALLSAMNAKTVWEVNLQSLQTQTLALQAPVAMLTPMRVAGDYLLTWQPGGLAWMIDTNQPKGAVYLIPAAVTAQAGLLRR